MLSLGKNEKNELQKRLIYSKNWIEKYAPVELRIQINEHAPEEIKEKLNDDEKMALRLMIEELNNESNEEELQSHIYQIARQNAVEPKRFFQLMYQIILNRDNGPRLGPFMFVIGKEKVIRLLEEAAKN
jgi:lysyl-tRNA synthetase class 1